MALNTSCSSAVTVSDSSAYGDQPRSPPASTSPPCLQACSARHACRLVPPSHIPPPQSMAGAPLLAQGQIRDSHTCSVPSWGISFCALINSAMWAWFRAGPSVFNFQLSHLLAANVANDFPSWRPKATILYDSTLYLSQYAALSARRRVGTSCTHSVSRWRACVGIALKLRTISRIMVPPWYWSTSSSRPQRGATSQAGTPSNKPQLFFLEAPAVSVKHKYGTPMTTYQRSSSVHGRLKHRRALQPHVAADVLKYDEKIPARHLAHAALAQ